MTITADKLPNDIDALKAIIMQLLEELNLWRDKCFGRSAEPLPPKGEVFNEAEVEAEQPVDPETPSDDDAGAPETDEGCELDEEI